MAWNPFGVLLEISASAATVTRTAADKYTVKFNVAWETYYSGAQTLYGMTASSGGGSVTLNPFGTKSSGGSGSFTGTYAISGNSAATKTVTVTFRNFNNDNGDSATKTINLSVSVPAWTSYTIKYNANGGTGAPSNQTKWKDQTLKLSSTKPTRTGYLFQGWATSASGSVAYAAGANYTANAGATLYAVWSPKPYQVAYNANGGTGAPSSQTKYHDVTLALSNTKPTRTNYTFKGWGTSASSTTVSYAPGASYKANAGITLYAIWELAYTKPRITNFNVVKCDADGVAQTDGAYALVTCFWDCDYAVSAITISWKTATEKDYSSHVSVSATGDMGTISKVIGGTLDSMSTYDIKVTVSDSVDSTEKTKTLSSLAFTIHARSGGDGVAFGKTSELLGVADFNFEVLMRKKQTVNNNVGIYGYTTNGVAKQVFQPFNTNDNTILGYDNYDLKSGGTHIYGHDLLFGVSNIANPGTFRPYLRQGMSVSMMVRTAGYVTNSKTEVHFTVPMSRPIIGSPTASVTSGNGFILRQGDKYTHGSAASTYVIPTKYSATVDLDVGVVICATFSDLTNAINNETVGIYWDGTITFG